MFKIIIFTLIMLTLSVAARTLKVKHLNTEEQMSTNLFKFVALPILFKVVPSHTKSIMKRSTTNMKHPRSAYWGLNDVSQRQSVWQPQVYQVNAGPYFIPIWNGGAQLYYTPAYNQRKNDIYATTNVYEETPVKFDNDDDDDAPTWGERTPTTPKPYTFPPLVYLVDSKKNGAQNSRRNSLRSLEARKSTTTTMPFVETETQPTRCTWAIISCCLPSSPSVKYNCFEELGCIGAFWGNSPCDRKMAIAAANAVSKYYDSK